MNKIITFKKFLFESKNWNNFVLLTSNQNKLREFNSFGLPIKAQKGRDINEVSGTDIEVIIYKSKDSGEFTIVEDTSLNVEGLDVGVNIRWMLDKINNLDGKKANWKVLLGVNDNTYISIYQGILYGTLKNINEIPKDAFGFDPVFVPVGTSKTLYELNKEGKKEEFSARKMAVDNLLMDKYIEKIKISDIKPWTGEYQ